MKQVGPGINQRASLRGEAEQVESGDSKNQKSEKLKIKENTEKSEIQKYNNRN